MRVLLTACEVRREGPAEDLGLRHALGLGRPAQGLDALLAEVRADLLERLAPLGRASAWWVWHGQITSLVRPHRRLLKVPPGR